jgi:dTDP-4-dehydrorhamnose 3,5-epimerase
MEVIKTHLEGLLELRPKLFYDERGYFFESFNSILFQQLGLPDTFVQDNQSFSKRGVIRGLHLQLEPYSQGKLVKVMTGRVLDVVVDVRPQSKTFGQHAKVLLDAQANNLLWVPPGFAHGFSALEDSIFHYKCTSNYHKASEYGILWNDPALAIDWELAHPLVSEKDQLLPNFATFCQKLKLTQSA